MNVDREHNQDGEGVAQGDEPKGGRLDRLPSGEDVRGISVRRNGDLYVSTGLGNIYRYPGGSAAGRVLLTSLGVPTFVGLAFSPDSTVLYATTYSTGSLYTVDPDIGSSNLVVNGGLGLVYGIEVLDCDAGWNNYGRSRECCARW